MEHTCLNCGQETDESQTFCDDECEQEYQGIDDNDIDEDEEF